MRNQSHKANQFLLLLLKFTVVLAALLFIGYKLTSDNQLDFMQFLRTLHHHRVFSAVNIMILLLLTFFNWFFEVKKWQNLSNAIRGNSVKKATKESLASFTAAIFTPSRIGEYGAKSLYYAKSSRKKVIFLNFLGNITQLLVTVFFGIVGLIYFVLALDLPMTILNGFLLVGAVASPFLMYWMVRRYNWKIKGFSVDRLEEAFRRIPINIRAKTLIFAALRYLIFTHQFYFFLVMFKVELPYFLVMAAVFSTYFLASIIPTMMIFDAVIKGGFAVWIFGFIGVPQMVVLVIVLAVWILNFGLPALLGSYYVLRFRPPANPELS